MGEQTVGVAFCRFRADMIAGWDRSKDTSLCSIGILAALGRHGALKIVFGIALSSGATVDEITEALLQVDMPAIPRLLMPYRS